jgi:hypothetical protein
MVEENGEITMRTFPPISSTNGSNIYLLHTSEIKELTLFLEQDIFLTKWELAIINFELYYQCLVLK